MTEPSESGAAPAARILIVDDEAAQMKALCDTLRDRGFDVVGHSSSAQALSSLREGEFDLLLTDIQMPEMDGMTLLKAASEVDPNLVGIIMTGHATMNTAIEAMRLGAFDYIQKPFKLGVALPAITRALGVGRLRRENADLLRHLRQRTTELEAANKELEAFSYSVAHDLRGPLRGVNGFATMLLEDYASQLPEEARPLLTRIMSGATRMGQLIDDLLRLSQIGRQPIDLRSVDMRTMADAVVEELRESDPTRSVEITIGDLPPAVGDQFLLRQVFVNLLANAFKFTRDRDPAVIEVTGSVRADELVYVIRDNGAGFDMQYASKLFGVFQRMHGVEQFEGTGVGLSIVHRILARHGGRVWANGVVNKGAEFFFALPVRTEETLVP